MSKMPVESPAELKEAYPFDCANCGHSQMAAPSIFMSGFGMNVGGGNCMNCGTALHLEIAPENDRMISKDRAEWVIEETERLRKEREHES